MTPEETASLRRSRRRLKTRRVLLACVVLFAGSSFLLGFFLDSASTPAAWLVPACLGTIGAQGGLHAIWCVFASASLAKRFAWGAVAGLGLFGAWALGLAFCFASRAYATVDDWNTVVTVLLCLPLLAVVIQSPLWVARCFLRWRILHHADPARRSPLKPMHIRDLLIATGAVAVALSAARVGLMVSGKSLDAPLLALVMGALVATAVSLFTTLPAVVAALRDPRLWLTLPATLLLDLAVMVGFVAAVSTIGGSCPPREEYPMLALLAVSFFVCLTAPLLLVRRLGYRLYWGRRRPHAVLR